MYAKLVTRAGSPTLGYANSSTNATANIAVWFNTVIDVITGAITNVNSVNSTVFDTSLCEIISTVAPGWSIYDNTASNAVFSNTAPPVVIRAAYTDNASAYKYLWCGIPGNTSHANTFGGPVIRWIPMEDWNSTTNVPTNALIAISNTPNAYSSGYTNWYDCPGNLSGSPGYPAAVTDGMTKGTTTIISASASHLYMWTCHDQFGANTSLFQGNFLVSEYSRDDPWNTPENGFPSWGMFGSSGAATSQGANTGSDGGTIIRILNPNTGTNSIHIAPYTGPGYTTYNYSLRSRLGGYVMTQNSAGTYAPFTQNTAYGSWGKMGNYVNYPPSFKDARNSANNVGFALSDIRIVPTGGLYDTPSAVYYGTHIAYGSITAKSPYIYLFRSQYQNLDEFVIDGVGYINLNTTNNHVVTNTAFATTIVVKKV